MEPLHPETQGNHFHIALRSRIDSALSDCSHLSYLLHCLSPVSVSQARLRGLDIDCLFSAFVVDEIDYSLSLDQKLLFLKAVQSYWPGIKEEDLTPGYSGVRPKLRGIKDFVIDSGTVSNSQFVNVLGYASPGLTSSLALAIEVSEKIET